MLTALAIAQSTSPHLSISVILPHYSFLRESHEAKTFVDLGITVRGSNGNPSHVGCRVSLLQWEYSANVDFLNPDLEVAQRRESRTIDIYLIGPGDRTPFDVAFKASDAGDVYSAYKPLKQEWKDLWFAKAASELVAYLSVEDGSAVFDEDLDRDAEGEGGETPARSGRGVDVVHLHGATNAMVAYYLRQFEASDSLGSHLPAIVYALHDSLDEVEYSNLVSNVRTFLDPPSSPLSLSSLDPYIHSSQLFTSSLGIDLSDLATFVSQSIATDIVEGRFQFSLRDLVMPSISARAATHSFYGITNGLDFTELPKNPFLSPLLLANDLAFPRVGANITDYSTFWTREPTTTPTFIGSTGLEAVSFSHTKERAKSFLVESFPSLFDPTDVDTPFFLFIGRFQHNKGCAFFLPLLRALSSPSSPLSGRLIVLGAENNYPLSSLQKLQRQYPAHMTLLPSLSFQAEWGPVVRMASDFAFVPSFSEAFGLVAAEGMLFGMAVVSTGVGGLGEFLEEMGEDGKRGNAFLWELEGGQDWSTKAVGRKVGESEGRACEEAVGRAVEGWRRRMDGRETGWVERERFVRRLVAQALELSWVREKGPVEEVRLSRFSFWVLWGVMLMDFVAQYTRVYDLALARRRRSNIDLKRAHEELADGPFLPSPPHEDLDEQDLEQLSEQGGLVEVMSEEEDSEGVEQARRLPIFKIWVSHGGEEENKVVKKRKKRKTKGKGKGKT